MGLPSQPRPGRLGTVSCPDLAFVAVVSDLVELGPVRCAELAAPAITRAFVSGMRAGSRAGRQLVERYGGAAVGYVIDLRNPLAAGRNLSTDELAPVYRYVDPNTCQDTIAASVTGGLLERDAMARDQQPGVAHSSSTSCTTTMPRPTPTGPPTRSPRCRGGR